MEGYFVEQFTTADGLPSNRIRSIHQDQYGFMWFGTNQGLVKYDGFDFKTYFPDPMDSLSISPRAIAAIAEDKKGNLWVGGDRFIPSGVSYYDREKDHFTVHISKESEVNPEITDGTHAILVSQDDEVWIGSGFAKGDYTVGGAIRRIKSDGSEIIFKDSTYEDTSSHFTTGILEDTKGNIWLTGFGLRRYDPIADDFEHYLPDPENSNNKAYQNINYFTSIYEPPSKPGTLLLGSHAGGIVEFNVNARTFKRIDLSNHIDQGSGVFSFGFFAEVQPGIIWLRIRDALHIYDMNTGQIKRSNLTGTSHIERIVKDSNGSIWIGTWSDGLFKISPVQNAFSVFSPELKSGLNIPSSEINAISTIADGTLWLSRSGQFYSKPPKDFAFSPFDITFPPDIAAPNSMFWIESDTSGNIWFAECGSVRVFRVNPKSMSYEWYGPGDGREHSLVSGCPSGFFTDNAGRLWLRNWFAGIEQIDIDTGAFTHYTHIPGDSTSLISNHSLRIYEAPSEPGILWVGTQAGLSRLDVETGVFTNFDDPDLNWSVSMLEDSRGQFWIATASRGLHLFDRSSETWKTYNTDNGMPGNIVWSVLEDNHGYLWLSTDNGLSRFDANNERFQNFTIQDGLPDNEFTEMGFAKGPDGLLYYKTQTGFIKVDPNQITEITHTPEVLFTSLFINDKPQTVSEKGPLKTNIERASSIILQPDENSIRIQYAGIGVSNPKRLKYLYRLINYENDWIDAGASRSIRYPNLPPGKYRMEVKAGNTDGTWSDVRSINITVLPPWWKTTKAFIVYGFLLLAGVIGIDRIQRRRILSRARLRAEREQAKAIAKTNTELQLTLIELQNTQDQLIHAEKMASLGQLTAGIAHEIKNPLNFVNNFSRLSVGAAEELVELLEEKRGIDDEDVSDLIETLKMNARKINQHGVRADNIVRSMLDHSRTEAGEKRPVDINKLVDEHINLAFHSWKASIRKNGKDTPPPPTIERDLCSEVGEATVVPQDIGRVLINLINNGLYAVSRESGDKSRESGDKSPESGDKSPESGVVRVCTARSGEFVEIRVEDNGVGIPRDKLRGIFEPFYTTKPTGSGTGLGLSLSHDIVVKGHGGELNVKSRVGEGTTFVIRLPI